MKIRKKENKSVLGLIDVDIVLYTWWHKRPLDDKCEFERRHVGCWVLTCGLKSSQGHTGWPKKVSLVVIAIALSRAYTAFVIFGTYIHCMKLATGGYIVRPSKTFFGPPCRIILSHVWHWNERSASCSRRDNGQCIADIQNRGCWVPYRRVPAGIALQLYRELETERYAEMYKYPQWSFQRVRL